MKKSGLYYHLLCILIIIVWGTTFISTKYLLREGLTPADIFFYRFFFAYLLLATFAPRRLWADNWKDEITFVILGASGGSIYFLSENTALEYTLTANVSLIVSAAPLLTILLSRFFLKGEGKGHSPLVGALVALAGVALVIFNGRFIMELNPIGDFLSLSAAFLWAIYSIFLRKTGIRYPTLFVTRKVFGYGVLTILPYFLYRPLNTDFSMLIRPIVLSNLFFLTVIASLLCFIGWNFSVKRLGAVVTSNYIYFIPIIALISSAYLLNEPVTWIAIIGAIMVLSGVYLARQKK